MQKCMQNRINMEIFAYFCVVFLPREQLSDDSSALLG